MAELLDKYNLRGTFYIPATNAEGRDTIVGSDLRDLASTFEIGGHTFHHIYLDKLDLRRASQEIVAGKDYLEQKIGKSIAGFCYPGGKYNQNIRKLVINAGFEYARTIANFSLTPGNDVYQLSTTLQFFNHGKLTYIKNYLDNIYLNGINFPLLFTCLSSSNLSARLDRILEFSIKHGGIFHLWGHSWEIEQQQAWKLLDAFFARTNSLLDKNIRIDNHQIARIITSETVQ